MVFQGSNGNTSEQFKEIFEKTFLAKNGFQHSSRLMAKGGNSRQGE